MQVRTLLDSSVLRFGLLSWNKINVMKSDFSHQLSWIRQLMLPLERLLRPVKASELAQSRSFILK